MTAAYQTAHLAFGFPLDSPSGKTKCWDVAGKTGGLWIGQVKWHGPWRKYCFFPNHDTLYDTACLREIADFCEARTKEHRQ